VRPSPIIIFTPFQHGKVRITLLHDHVPCLSGVITLFWILDPNNQSVYVKPSILPWHLILTHNYFSTLSSWQGYLHAKFLTMCHG
jgi:hypothetical protein